MKYAFIALHRLQFSVRTMCRLLRVHPSGFYAWLKAPLSKRAIEDRRQTELLRSSWEDSGKVYGYRKLHDDLLDQGEACCPNRVARLTRLAGIKAQIGYKRRPGSYGGKPSVAVDNTLDRQFDVEVPDKAWVTDITYIRTLEGFAYLAVVIDLYSRRVIGWALQSRQATDDLLHTLRELEGWKVSVIAMNGMAFDLSSPHGRMLATFLSGIADFERDLISERVKSGLAAAKARGKRLGRQTGERPKSDRLALKVMALIAEGRSYRWIARDMAVSKNTVAEIVKRTRAPLI